MKEPVKGCIRSYKTAADRKRAQTQLANRGMNYFVGFCDRSFEGHPFELNYGIADWVPEGECYLSDARAETPVH